MISRAVMPTRRSRTWVFLWIALFLMGILLQYGVALSRPATALAASSLKAQTVQGFEVDGDLKGSNASVDAATCSAVQSGPGCIPDTEIAGGVPMTDGGDWLSVGANTVVNDGYNNSSDTWFDKGKELDTRDWSYKTSAVSPGKDDIRTAMGYGKFVNNGDAYFYAGAERVITNGSTHVTFELDRKPFKTWADGVSKPNRTPGDVIIPIDFENGGVQPVVRIYKVTGVTDSANGQVVTKAGTYDSNH